MSELFKSLEGKRVRLWTNNNFFYRGTLILCEGGFVEINDRKLGNTILSNSSIKQISLDNGGQQ